MAVMTLLTYTGALVVTNCWCGIRHAIPDDLYRWAEQNHNRAVFCPLGHKWVVSGETDAQKLARQLTAEQGYNATLNRRLTDEQNHSRALKGVATKLRNRVIAGECSFCGQHLQHLARHIARMHPDEKPEADA